MSFENNVYAFINDLKKFNYDISYKDLIWNIIFPDQKNHWYHVRVTKYNDTFYIHQMDGDLCSLEVILNKNIQEASSFGFGSHHNGGIEAWHGVIVDAMKWLKTVEKNWIKANQTVHELYPCNRRYGIVPNALVRASLADIYRIDIELGKTKLKKFVRLVEEGYFLNEKNTTQASMTANDFFAYCKIAYIAGQEKGYPVDENLSGREMYKRYADGRDNGLLEIAGDSAQEFADWIDGVHPKHSTGGHPFEIKRGGNTTHIDLYASRPSYKSEGFIIGLRGASIGRLKETICMFLGIFDAGLSISIADSEGIRKRLLALDNIGIVPCFDSLHRANQHFHEHEDVDDVLYYDDLGRYKRRIKPFITWEPLPILKIRD